MIAFIAQHWAQTLFFAGLFGSAIVAHMPVAFPRSIEDWWTWLRSSLQQIANIKTSADGAGVRPTQGR